MAEKPFDMDGVLADPTRPHETIQLSFRNQDSAVWFASKQFTITRIRPKQMNPNAPDPFFFGRDPDAEAVEGGDGKWRVNSGPPRKEAIGFGYKVFFKNGPRLAQAPELDPDVDVGP